MTLNDIIDLNLLNRFLTNLRSLFATKSEVAAKPTGKIYYGTCSTTANTYIKEATVETFPLDENDKPLVGTVVAIKYSVSNTYKTEGQTYALNVNNTGTYPMYYNNAAVATSTSANTLVAGYKNRHVFYVFNGTQWVWLSASYDTNTTYSGMTQAEVDAGTGTTARLITPDRLRDNFYTEDEVDDLLESKADNITTVSHGTNDTTFALTPNVLHTWGTINSLTLTLASGSSTYVDGYWFKFTAGSSFTALTLPTGVVWAAEPEIEAGKTYEVFIVNNLATYITEGIESIYATKQWVQNNAQSPLVSGTNIKTINNESILGSGNITIQGGGGGNVSSTTVSTIVSLTEAEYTALSTKDSSTLYIITSS